MAQLLAAPMARSNRGRPTKEEGAAETKLIRVHGDVAEMIGWIVELQGIKTANLLDPLIRPAVLARYKQIEPEVEAVKKLREAARKKSGPGK